MIAMYRFFYQEWAFLQLMISLVKGLYLVLVYLKAHGFSFQLYILRIPGLKTNKDFIISNGTVHVGNKKRIRKRLLRLFVLVSFIFIWPMYQAVNEFQSAACRQIVLTFHQRWRHERVKEGLICK